MFPKKESCLIFTDYPEFKPNKTPKEMFEDGVFGGTYFRPIHSRITGKNHAKMHKKFTFLSKIPEDKLSRTCENADVSINKYGVKVGTSLEFWENSGWITKYDPYGWVLWYCNFYNGRRCPDDERQIKRWNGIAGPNGRFKKNLIRQIYESKKKWNDSSVSPKIRQTLLHWCYELTKKDYDSVKKEIK